MEENALVPAAPDPARAVGAPEDGEDELDDLPPDPAGIALRDAIAAGFRQAGIAFLVHQTEPALVVYTETDVPIKLICEEAAVIAFAPLLAGVTDPGEQAEAVMLLNRQAPIPYAWLALAAYRPGPEGEVGLGFALPMPKRPSFALLADMTEFVGATAAALTA